MLRLLLLRHAKSDRPPGVADLDRPLNPRGRAAAPRMAAYLAEEGLVPGLALVSPSARTRQTFAPVAETFADLPVRYERGIYEAPASALLTAIRGVEEPACLILVGHNPGMQDLATNLVGSGTHAARVALATQFPTAALAVIDFDASAWGEIGWGGGRLERYVRPRDLSPALAE
ncbi:SixA phosphatase family protein [Methylobacterium sp. sgz302541]|uniref:SixA phosphatase family protein n=1 Tax=unclassified Methylobacterium TaxID=2615210 RepID=UPI003D3393C9